MALKNYTTTVKSEKTIAEIEMILAKHGATHVFKQYEDGKVVAVAFKYQIEDQIFAFKLPMNAEKILRIFELEGLTPKYRNIDQAERTGWRIIKDWIDSQMALLEVHLVKFEEIFLPYMWDGKKNQTLFESMQERGFKQLEYKEE